MWSNTYVGSSLISIASIIALTGITYGATKLYPAAGVVVLGLGLTTDLYSMFLLFNYRFSSRVFSGLPLFAWLIYLGFSLAWWNGVYDSIIAVLCFSAFHVSCQMLVRIVGRKLP